MSRGGKRAKGKQGPADPGPFAPVYEGPEVVTALLAHAGSPATVDEAADRFARALEAGEERSDVIPGLFPDEPRFASPAEARRLYSTLYGLWDRVAAGLGVDDDAPEVAPAPPPPPPLPDRGSLPGNVLSRDLVERMWRHLGALPEREARRLRDRYANVQPDLVAWLDEVELPEEGALAATDLVFEAWAMFDQAFGERLEAVAWKDLEEVEEEPPPIDGEQPALAAYASEQLDLLADEDPTFGPEERAQVERVVSAAAAALARAVRIGGN